MSENMSESGDSMGEWGDATDTLEKSENVIRPAMGASGVNMTGSTKGGELSLTGPAGGFLDMSLSDAGGNPVAAAGGAGGGGGGGGGGELLGSSILGGGWIGAGEGLIGLNDAEDRPMLPMHSADEIKIGSKVWLCAAEDFATLMKAEFCPEVIPLTHGNAVGIVKRHSENSTFVQFEAQEGSDTTQGFSLPRPGLSLKKIDAKKPTMVYKNKLGGGEFGGVGDLGPKAGRQNANKSDGNEALTAVDVYITVTNEKSTNPASPQVAKPKPKDNEVIKLYKQRLWVDAEDKLSKSIQDHQKRRSAAPSPAGSPTKPQDKRMSMTEEAGMASTDEMDEFGLTEKEALIWRAGCRLKRGSFDSALQDALKCIENDADWAPGYVRSAEIYIAQGKHESARGLLNQAAFLNQGSNTGLASLIEANEALARTDTILSKKGLSVTVDGEKIRRLVAKRRFEKGDVILSERPSVWIPTMANEANLCVNCGRVVAKGEGIPPPNVKLDTMYACSTNCAKDANSKFRDYENSPIGAKATYAANFVIRDRANSVTNLEQLEWAQLAMRAFHCIVVLAKERAFHGAATGEFPVPFSLVPEMQQFGLLPAPNSDKNPIDNKTKGDVGTLWTILTAQFSQSEKDAFPVSIFNTIYLSVKQYAVRKEAKQADGKLKSRLLLFPNLGCSAHDEGTKSMVDLLDASTRSSDGSACWDLVALGRIESQAQV